ncbi:hypothetical protein JCM14244_15140 [Venenivibrio stagnispumantis]|uniref:Uncharacterized membrane protein YidH, DUF202 family n=1 Tax=Venenivibrio stagnispumantis TaxID=407998 RepID=A0AA46AD16_9AQUI|nr:DUF202 domain-containing protein [Venenivibrio stagnispumantis]MCW4572506.1 DUF202 domain-containing protein [Venenivibrio stagnispumantis]SMP02135.1 Uncharacterized membrane protein YidH, DUF202 family [Venenivibrio stagnispumantis]
MNKIDPKDIMAVQRSTIAIIRLAISMMVLGFVIEKFQLFLDVIIYEIKGKSLPAALQHAEFYNYLGIFIIIIGVLISLYAYYYYIKWIEYLSKGELYKDKKIYLLLSISLAFIGFILILSMLIV